MPVRLLLLSMDEFEPAQVRDAVSLEAVVSGLFLLTHLCFLSLFSQRRTDM